MNFYEKQKVMKKMKSAKDTGLILKNQKKYKKFKI